MNGIEKFERTAWEQFDKNMVLSREEGEFLKAQVKADKKTIGLL